MSKLKVLIVDDDAFIRRIVEITLCEVANWDVVTAGSGVEALTVLQTMRPDVVLLDVMMPGMDGPTTLAKIRETIGSDLPVILMTAKVQSDDMKSYLRTNATGVISKPFDPMTLPDEVMDILSSCKAELCKTA